MSEILVTCTDCGTTLKVSGESPEGRFVRCPNCTTIFIANKLERTPPAGAAAGPKLTCPDCGAIQYSLQPIAGGKFVRCVECATAFRVPGPAVPLSLPRPAPAVSPKTSPSAPRPRSPAPEKPSSAASRPAAARYELIADDPTQPYKMLPTPAPHEPLPRPLSCFFERGSHYEKVRLAFQIGTTRRSLRLAL